MNTTIANNIRIDDPTREVSEWCVDNLIVPNPEYSKKIRMGFWVGDTPSELRLFETDGKSLIFPFGVLRNILPLIEQSPLKTAFTGARSVDYNANVPLYDYQEIAVEKTLSAQYGILRSAAGSGKTQMGISMICKLGRRALWLTHTKDLLKQSLDRAKQYIDSSLLGTISEGKVNIGEGITFATVQTMANINLILYRDTWDVIIVDECHRVAGTPTAMTLFYKVLNNLSARHKYGLSATVHRSDGLIKATYAILGDVVYSVPDEAVKERVMQVGILPVDTGITYSRECLNTDGTINFAKMTNYLCGNKERNRLIANYLVENSDRSCLILSDRIDHLKTLMGMLPPSMKEEAAIITGSMTKKKDKAEREGAIEDMRQGRKKYLFATYALAKEGLDIPRLECLFLTTVHRDYAVITQSIGRVARVFPGKAEPTVIDFIDDMEFTMNAYKRRKTIYKKNGCYLIGKGEKGF